MTVCAADGCDELLVQLGRGRPRRFCSTLCRQRACLARRAGLDVDDDFELTPYWREYLRRFDRAIFERSEEAWAACHEMVRAPDPTDAPHFRYANLAAALSTLAEPPIR